MNPILCFVCFVFCSVRLLWGDPRSTRSFCHDIGQQLALRVFIFTYCCYMYWSRCQQTKYLYHSNFLCFFLNFSFKVRSSFPNGFLLKKKESNKENIRYMKSWKTFSQLKIFHLSHPTFLSPYSHKV